MSEAASLLMLLRRIRRRVKLWIVVEGVVMGAAAGVIVLAVAIAIAHGIGRPVGVARPLAVALVAAVAGGLVRGARRVSLESCARFADAALDGQDRVLSAFCLRDQETPLARALLTDAAARAGALTPGGAVAPRRPKGLPVLALGAIVLAAAAVAPVRSRAARMVAAPPPAPGTPLPASVLDVERAQARRAALEAARLHDDRLASLTAELNRTLSRLAAGTLSDGDALEKLAGLQRQAAEAADEAARDAKALAAAQKALAAETATRRAGEALTADDGDAGARARAALGAAAADNPQETARALGAAAHGVSGALGGASGERNPEGQRRLSRDGERTAEPGAGAGDREQPGERRLERLQRNLNDTAKACRDGDPSCRAQAEQRGQDLGQMAGRSARAEAARRLERAIGQMHQRLGRGEMRGGDQSAMRGFERAARGESGQPGQGQGQADKDGEKEGGQRGDGVGTSPGTSAGGGQGDATAKEKEAQAQAQGGDKTGKGKGAGAGQPGEDGEEGDGAGAGEAAALLGERETRERGESSGAGDGQGNSAGGAPLGRRGDMQTHGRESEARVANGAGPNRAEVIGGAADRGFAQSGYARVFADYEAAVEDALSTTAVPEGRRYVVRRYFDLIRPRPGKVRGSHK